MRPVAGLAAAIALVAGGCSAAEDIRPTAERNANPGDASSTSTNLPEIQTVKAAGGQKFTIGRGDWLLLAGGSVWTTLPSGDVIGIDPDTGQKTARIPSDGVACTSLDAGFGSLWVTVCGERDGSVLRIDPVTGTRQAEIDLPAGMVPLPEGPLAAGEGSVWVVATTRGSTKRLLTIDPASNRVVAQRPVPEGAAGVRAGLGGLWVADAIDSRLLHLDPRTGRTLATIPVGFGARFFDVGEDAVWVQNNGDGTVTRVDPRSDQVLATIPVDPGIIRGGDLSVGGGYVWARTTDALVAQIDPADSRVVARIGVSEGSGSVAADEEAVWITAHDVGALYRVPLS